MYGSALWLLKAWPGGEDRYAQGGSIVREDVRLEDFVEPESFEVIGAPDAPAFLQLVVAGNVGAVNARRDVPGLAEGWMNLADLYVERAVFELREELIHIGAEVLELRTLARLQIDNGLEDEVAHQ